MAMSLQQEVVLLREQVAQLLALVGELRATIDQQQAHIDRLVKIAFGHKSERVEGPTLFDDLLDDPLPSDTPVSPEPPEPDEPVVPKRKGHGRTAYAWLYLGDASQPYTVFDLTAGRGEEHPTRFLSGYRGFLLADGYAGYNTVHGHERPLGCWAHVRRKFVEAQTSDPARASEALAFIRALYAVERQIITEQLVGDNAVSMRRSRAGPVLNSFGEWIEQEHRTVLPKSPLGQAVGYARNQWPSLGRYLADARFSIDNNVAERAVRPLACPRPQPVGLPHRGADADVGQTHRPHPAPPRRLGQTNAIADCPGVGRHFTGRVPRT